jgi:hypothetical protein
MPTGTPYITPAMLADQQTGVAWQNIPEVNALPQQTLATQTQVCWQATSIVDTFCNQVLRATVDNELLTGPGARMSTLPGTDVGRLVMRRWPVTEVLAIQISKTRDFPASWTPVPAGLFEVERPLINTLTDTASATAPDGGSGILVAPGYIPPLTPRTRNTRRALVSYTNGWPHTSLTAAATASATVLQVDDVTGFAGASAFVYDGADTEPVAVLSVSATSPLVLPNGVGTAQTGPGTITLASPLANAHPVGAVVSSLPANVIWAVVLAAAAQVLESGITAITAQSLSGSISEGGTGVDDLKTEYEILLAPFKRIV